MRPGVILVFHSERAKMLFKIYGAGSVVKIEACSSEQAEAEFLQCNPGVSIEKILARRCDA